MANEYDGTEVITQEVVVFWDVQSDWILITVDGHVYFVGMAETYNNGPVRLSEKMEDSALVYLQ